MPGCGTLAADDLPRLLRLAIVGALLVLVVGGCASTRLLPAQDALGYQERTLTSSKGGLQVSTSVLSADESLAVYGLPLASEGIQPVWVKVENGDDLPYWLLELGLDPDVIPPTEAADVFARRDNRAMVEATFRELAFRNPVPPGGSVSGFVLANLDEGLKMVQVDLLANGRTRSFSFLNPVPGFRADYHSREVFTRQIYPPEDIIDHAEEASFRAALEALPCCATNRKGTRNGDPLNLVIVGGVEDAFPALVRRGWQPTEETWSGSVTKMIQSALAAERYPYAPVSPLYLYGRPQDLALQRARDNIHQRNHLRLWLSPMRYRGKPVWVGQISRDIGSRLTIHSPYLTTHKIDPDVDEARTALTEDLAYSQNLAAIGLVRGVGEASRDAPRKNLTTDPYYTDGARAVLIFDAQPRSLAEIDFLPWESREGGFLQQFQEVSR
jgi:hypothetical protein